MAAKLTAGQAKALEQIKANGGVYWHWKPNKEKIDRRSLSALITKGLVRHILSHEDETTRYEVI